MTSWFHPATEKRSSAVEGRGLFAREPISVGEIVAVKGGTILNRERYEELKGEISPAEIQIEDDLFIGPVSAAGIEENLLCLNHSCDPNVGVRGQVSFAAMRAIEAGEELTIDYAMIDGDPDERMECRCGSGRCRGVITGDDWRLPELQARYRGYFSRYLAERIERDEKR